MRLTRNHYFLGGMVVLLLGIQFRTVDSYLLNKEASDVVTKIWQKAQAKKQEQKPSSVIPVTFFSQPPAALMPSAAPPPPANNSTHLIASGSRCCACASRGGRLGTANG